MTVLLAILALYAVFVLLPSILLLPNPTPSIAVMAIFITLAGILGYVRGLGDLGRDIADAISYVIVAMIAVGLGSEFYPLYRRYRLKRRHALENTYETLLLSSGYALKSHSDSHVFAVLQERRPSKPLGRWHAFRHQDWNALKSLPATDAIAAFREMALHHDPLAGKPQSLKQL